MTANSNEYILDIRGLKVHFEIKGGILQQTTGVVKAVDGVNLKIRRGEILGLVGESGCGKTTVGRAILRLIEPTEGEVYFLDKNIPDLPTKDLKPLRRQIQIVFQDPISSLDPRVKIGPTVGEGLNVHRLQRWKQPFSTMLGYVGKLLDIPTWTGLRWLNNLIERQTNKTNLDTDYLLRLLRGILVVFWVVISVLVSILGSVAGIFKSLSAEWDQTGNIEISSAEIRQKVVDALKKVGLEETHVSRFPHEFSGGQRQRIGIARALVLDPTFIVLDEPVSALDVSIQSQVLNLLKDLQQQLDLTLLFIAHNMSVIEHLCDRVAVMYLGKIVEVTSREELFNNPQHPYTQALMSAIPIPDPKIKRDRIILEGDVPSPLNPPRACRFHTRCREAIEICSIEEPPLIDIGNQHLCACHLRLPPTEELSERKQAVAARQNQQ
jgi:peptide/nickel transport system ATP-binding protein